MVWSIENPHEIPDQKTRVRVDSVLYEYDGPQLFRGHFGFVDATFVKIDELDGHDLWLASASDEITLRLIETNQLSVRAAFLKDRLWIIQTDTKLNIDRYWSCSRSEIDETLLPEPGAALDPDVARVPDSLEQATSFFSIGFKGKELSTESVRFSTFKQLVDSAYDVSRKILGPKLIEGSKSGTFDLRIKPQIGSLIISVEEPILNYGRIEQRLSDAPASLEDVEDQIEDQKEAFFDGLQAAVKAVAHGEANEDLSETAKRALADILYIIPNQDYRFESIEFSTSNSEGVNTIFIDNETGGRIRRALDRSHYEPGTRTGVIVEINTEAGTFIIKSRTGRLTTCVCPPEIYDMMRRNKVLAIGARVALNGTVEKRKRRDRIFVRSYSTDG